MSALFGFINKNEIPAEQALLDKMLQAISHRATDGSFTRLYQHGAMGNCRLIVSPQQYFDEQPLEIGSLVITADARIDNRSELASYFKIDQVQLRNIPDSELILRGYQKWGKECVQHFDGEFAFAIWDQLNNQLFAATDPIGFRPFFYFDSPEVFIFCSEIKGVIKAKPLPNYFNDESLIEYYFRQGFPNQTYNREVFALCGGSTLTLHDKRISIQKYWILQAQDKYKFIKDEDWYACMRDLLYKAVEKRLNYDIPVGITLSGGLDSSSLACILSDLLQKKNKPLYAVSSVLPTNHSGIEKDERKYIELLGYYCPNIIQTYVDAPGVGPFTHLEENFETDESFPNAFHYMDRALLEVARGKGIRTLFTGFGGDYWVSWKGHQVIGQMIVQGEYIQAWQLLQQSCKVEQISLLRALRTKYFAYTDWYKLLRSFIKHRKINWQTNTTLHTDFLKKYNNRLHSDSLLDYTRYMKNIIEAGRIGKAAALLYNRNNGYAMDSAVPFFDKAVFEFLTEVPPVLFVKGGYPRSLIRNVMRGIIPEEINNRKDKLPYSPGYQNRILQQKPFVKKILESQEYNFVFNTYIDRNKIIEHFDEIVPEVGFTSGDKIVGIRMVQAINVCLVLNYLKTGGYVFQ